MSIQLSIPTTHDLDYASKMLALAGSIVKERIGEDIDYSKNDLYNLQTTIDEMPVEHQDTITLQSFGLVLGMIFTHQDANFDWWIIEDSLGRNLCIRYKESALLIFPQTMISRRIEDKQEINIPELYGDLEKQLNDVIERAEIKSCA